MVETVVAGTPKSIFAEVAHEPLVVVRFLTFARIVIDGKYLLIVNAHWYNHKDTVVLTPVGGHCMLTPEGMVDLYKELYSRVRRMDIVEPFDEIFCGSMEGLLRNGIFHLRGSLVSPAYLWWASRPDGLTRLPTQEMLEEFVGETGILEYGNLYPVDVGEGVLRVQVLPNGVKEDGHGRLPEVRLMSVHDVTLPDPTIENLRRCVAGSVLQQQSPQAIPRGQELCLVTGGEISAGWTRNGVEIGSVCRRAFGGEP